MKKVSIDDLKEALKKITFPEIENQNIIQLGIISSLTCDEKGKVICIIDVPPLNHHAFSQAQEAAQKMLQGVKGVTDVKVILTGTKKSAKDPLFASAKERKKKLNLENVRHIVAVGSGKGGVGKSTVSVNLARTFAKKGYKVGVLDADIHGPSLPTLMGNAQKPESLDGKTIIPQEHFGLKYMSIGFFAKEDQPITWRGPMVQGAVFQMLRDVKWGTEEEPLDYLFIDFPPGTGDIHMTVCQSISLYGAIIVSTPQDLSLIDARRAYKMFEQFGIKILGLVENMAVFQCPHCQEKSYIFGKQGVKREAKENNLPLLGQLPLDISLREGGDTGELIVDKEPESFVSEVFGKIMDNLLA